MATVTAALLAIALGAARVEVSPAFVTGGSAEVATIAIVEAKDGPWEVSTNVGTVTAPERGPDGIWRARFTAPPQRFPQVAIAFAQRRGSFERFWFTIPIHGSDTLKLSTKPKARVEVSVGNAKFVGTADAAGKVQVPIVAPPGVQTANVRSVDRLGNARSKPLDLEPPPFPRIRVAARGPARASWSDTSALALDLYAVDRAGSRTSEEIVAAVDEGTLTLEADGRVASFKAPESVGDGKAKLRAWLKGSSSAAVEYEIELAGGPAATLAAKATPSQYVAGSGEPLSLQLQAQDARGNPLALTGLASDFGALQVAADGTGSLRVPDFFQGRREVTLSIGNASAKIPLVSGPSTTGAFSFKSRLIHAGESLPDGEVELKDAFGNPVHGAELSVGAGKGAALATGETGPGRYSVRYDAPRDGQRGEDIVFVRPAHSQLELRSSLTVLPPRPAWGISAGVFAGGATNASLLLGGSAAAEVALGLGRLPVELIVQGGVNFYSPLRVERPDDNAYNEGSPRALFGLGGLRASIPLTDRWAVHLTGAAGVLQASARVNVRDASTGETIVSNDTSDTRVLLRGAAGASLALGPGRAFAELQLSYARAPETATVTGNLGGGSLAVGYLFYLR